MKKIIGSIILLCFLNSCNDDTFYQLQIIIKNETTSELNVKVFPKSEYRLGVLYDFGIGGGYRETEFHINPTDEFELFSTEDLKIEPNTLTAQVFDSIHVNSTDGNIKIKFSLSTVTGYPDNLYNDPANWSYEIRHFALPTQFKRNPVESHDYIFTITNQ